MIPNSPVLFRIAFSFVFTIFLGVVAEGRTGLERCDSIPSGCDYTLPVEALKFDREWLVKFELNNQPTYSGPSAYTDFTDRTIEVVVDEPCLLSIGVGFSTFTYDEFVKIWLDADDNG